MHPILGQVGPVTILTHDAFTLLALVVGLSIYYRELARRGWLDTRIVWISLAAVVAGAIGARTITAWEHLEYYTALDGMPLSVAIENSGKSLIGALAGGYLGTVLAKRAFGYTRSTGDCYVLAIPVATAIGRIGCFLSELPLGTPTTLPWGVSVSAEAAAAFAPCPGCELPMHPSMLYEILFNLVAVALIVRYRHRVPVVGDTLKLYLLVAGIFRFLVEFVRGNEPQALGLTGPQWVLIPLVGLLIAHFARQWWRGAWQVPVPSGVRDLAPTPARIDGHPAGRTAP
jgi:phosphatidylglycerol:prolipoprotein diacylglycerol transferase